MTGGLSESTMAETSWQDLSNKMSLEGNNLLELWQTLKGRKTGPDVEYLSRSLAMSNGLGDTWISLYKLAANTEAEGHLMKFIDNMSRFSGTNLEGILFQFYKSVAQAPKNPGIMATKEVFTSMDSLIRIFAGLEQQYAAHPLWKPQFVPLINDIILRIELEFSEVALHLPFHSPHAKKIKEHGSKLAALLPDSIIIPYCTGALMFNGGDYEDAAKILEGREDGLQRFRQSVKPGAPSWVCYLDIDYYFLLAASYLELNKPESALVPAQKALERKPSFSKGHCILANIFSELGEFEKASTEYEAAVNHATATDDMEQALVNWAHLFEKLEDYERAKECYVRCLDALPTSIGAQIGLGHLDKLANNIPEAIGHYMCGLSRVPENHLEELILHQGYSKVQETFLGVPFKQIIAAFKRNISNNPKSLSSYYILFNLLEQQGEKGESSEVMGDILDILKMDPNIESHLRQIEPGTPARVPIENPIASQTIVLKGAESDSKTALMRLEKDYALTSLAWQLADLERHAKDEMAIRPLAFFRNILGAMYSVTKHAKKPNLLHYLCSETDEKHIRSSHEQALGNIAFFQAAMTNQLQERQGANYLDITEGTHKFRILLEAYDHMAIFLDRAVPTHKDDKAPRFLGRDYYQRGIDRYVDHFVDEVRSYVAANMFAEPLLVISGDERNKNFLMNGAMLDWERACLGNPIMAYVMKTTDPASAFFSGWDYTDIYIKSLQKSLDRFDFDLNAQDLKGYISAYVPFIALRFLGKNLGRAYGEGVIYCTKLFFSAVDVKSPLAQALIEWCQHDGRIQLKQG